MSRAVCDEVPGRNQSCRGHQPDAGVAAESRRVCSLEISHDIDREGIEVRGMVTVYSSLDGISEKELLHDTQDILITGSGVCVGYVNLSK